jgi:hypothetical protein
MGNRSRYRHARLLNRRELSGLSLPFAGYGSHEGFDLQKGPVSEFAAVSQVVDQGRVAQRFVAKARWRHSGPTEEALDLGE